MNANRFFLFVWIKLTFAIKALDKRKLFDQRVCLPSPGATESKKLPKTPPSTAKRAIEQRSAWKLCLHWILSSNSLLPLDTGVLSCLWGLLLVEVAFYSIATLNMCGPSSLYYVTGNDTKSNMPPCPLKRTLRETNTPRSLNQFSARLKINQSSYKNYFA